MSVLRTPLNDAEIKHALCGIPRQSNPQYMGVLGNLGERSNKGGDVTYYSEWNRRWCSSKGGDFIDWHGYFYSCNPAFFCMVQSILDGVILNAIAIHPDTRTHGHTTKQCLRNPPCLSYLVSLSLHIILDYLKAQILRGSEWRVARPRIVTRLKQFFSSTVE